jgi:ParB/RepB/Spo0J family partition protein
MTSGDFRKVLIDSIIIPRDERQRRKLKNIPKLAESIRKNGLLQPPVVTRDLVLVVGERRMVACKSLGWTDISIQFEDEVEPSKLKVMELEENVQREGIDWWDEYPAIAEIYRLRRMEDPEFSQTDLAEYLGRDPGGVSKILEAARHMDAGTELGKRLLDAPNGTTALNIVARANARQAEEQSEALWTLLNRKEPDSILNLDFNEWAKTYDGPKFNFVHCDFPYGIGANTFNQGSALLHGGYADRPEDYERLCESLYINLDRLCLPSCHFMFWFSMWKYDWTLKFFKERGITFDPFPLVWVKDDNVGILSDPQRGPRRIYETAFFGSRGDRPIVGSVSNAYAAPTDREFHMSTKPEPVLHHFFRMFVDESTRMLDPTCGSGSSLRAAKSLNAQYVLGLEIDKVFCEDANRSIKKMAGCF